MEVVKVRLTITWVSVIALSLMAASISNAAINPENIVAIWLFDEGKGDIAEDSSGNGHDGQIAPDIDRVNGKFDKAVELPGVIPQVITVPHEESLSLDTWSITAWIKADANSTGGWQEIIAKTINNNNRNYAMQLHQTTGVCWPHFTEGFAQYKVANGKTGLYDSEWHHVAGTYDKEFLRVYMDGVLEAEAPYDSTPDTHEGALTIGSLNATVEPFKGVIDDLGLFNKGLTEDEVRRIMDKGLAVAIGIAAVSPSGKLTATWSAIKTSGY